MAEFYVEFDLLDGHNPGTGATLSPIVLNPYSWRSIGHPEGGRFINQTGAIIRALHIKTNNSDNRFLVDESSIGRLFDVAWFKVDGTEAYFMEGNIPNLFGAFWMRTPPNTQLEIQQCDSSVACPFNGQAFEDNPPPPQGADWIEIRNAIETVDERWLALRRATPSEYRDIQSYSENTGGDQILFLSKGELFLYSHEDKTVEKVSQPAKTHPTTNRITFDKGEFQLWSNDRVLSSFTPSKSK